jgi:hypothetical protein
VGRELLPGVVAISLVDLLYTLNVVELAQSRTDVVCLCVCVCVCVLCVCVRAVFPVVS